MVGGKLSLWRRCTRYGGHFSVTPRPPQSTWCAVFLGCLEQLDNSSYKKRDLLNQFEMGFHGDTRNKLVTIFSMTRCTLWTSGVLSLCSKTLAWIMMGCRCLNFCFSTYQSTTNAYLYPRVFYLWGSKKQITENSETRGVRSVQAEQAGLNTHAFGRINCPRPGSSLGSSGQTALVPQSVSWAVARMVLFAWFCLFCMCVGCACCVHKQVCVRVLACGDLRLTSGPSVTLHLVTEAGSPGEPSLLQGSAVSAFQPPSSGITGRLPPPPGPRACVASTWSLWPAPV